MSRKRNPAKKRDPNQITAVGKPGEDEEDTMARTVLRPDVQAAVTLKEGRRLGVAHRESPLTSIDLRNARLVTEAGAVYAPLSPGFYLLPRTVDDLAQHRCISFVSADPRLPSER